MSANFDDLPAYVAFLHGEQFSWHSELSAEKVNGTKPDDVEMLSGEKCIWPGGPSGGGYHSDLLSRRAFALAVTTQVNRYCNSSFHILAVKSDCTTCTVHLRAF